MASMHSNLVLFVDWPSYIVPIVSRSVWNVYLPEWNRVIFLFYIFRQLFGLLQVSASISEELDVKGINTAYGSKLRPITLMPGTGNHQLSLQHFRFHQSVLG